MQKLTCLLLSFLGASSFAGAVAAHAHETNLPLTKLEAFETQTGAVIIKGTGQIGSVSSDTATVSIRCRESVEAASGRREYGLLVAIKENNRDEDSTFIDYDEVDSLLAGLDYIARVDYSITDLPSFAVGYTTRDGLRILVYSSNKNPGTIQPTLQTKRETKTKILLAPSQFAQIRTLLQQAKEKLDSLRNSRAK